MAPTQHPCTDGSHGCDATSTYCAINGPSYTCVCLQGFTRIGCSSCTATQCTLIPLPTHAPTGAPTRAPTASPTISPSAAPSAAPTAFPTASPSNSPTTSPTVSPTTSRQSHRPPRRLLHRLIHRRSLQLRHRQIPLRLGASSGGGVTGSAGGIPIWVFIIIGGVALFVVIAVVVANKRGAETVDSAERDMKAFSNPIYDNDFANSNPQVDDNGGGYLDVDANLGDDDVGFGDNLDGELYDDSGDF